MGGWLCVGVLDVENTLYKDDLVPGYELGMPKKVKMEYGSGRYRIGKSDLWIQTQVSVSRHVEVTILRNGKVNFHLHAIKRGLKCDCWTLPQLIHCQGVVGHV